MFMDINKNICFLITSVIYFKNNPLSYTKTRSVFSSQERVIQTINTVSSIRKILPLATIILVESGLREELPEGLDSLVDKYVYLGNQTLVRLACDSRFKGIGEIVSLIYSSKYIPDNADMIFKISGRYYLNDRFDIKRWTGQYFMARKYDNDISTRLYALTKVFLSRWRCALFLSLPFLLTGQSIERILSKLIPDNYIQVIKPIGVSGLGAAFGDQQED